jgi:regulator of RNase E activity RraA
MTEPLTPAELEELRRIPTPAIANGIELFNIRPRTAGWMSPEIRCIFDDLEPMIGYSATGMTTAASPHGRRVSPPDYWKHVLDIPEPRIAVFHDLDEHVAGAQWGEVMANIHQALGCVGAVTDGSVRDLGEAHDLGFRFFARYVGVSHGYVHMVDYGIPVTVGGLEVCPGDLLVADRHGVVQIPLEVARDVPQAVGMVEDWERAVIEASRPERWTLERMTAAFLSPRPTWPGEGQTQR